MSDELKLKDYDVISLIGKGGFGTCYKVQKKGSHEVLVWKAIDYSKMSIHGKERIVSEVNLLSTLDHPNIVRYYGRINDKKTATLYIIMEYCQGGDLETLIKKAKKRCIPIEENFIWHVLYQTGRAIQACHSLVSNMTVIHRDIKPANVFLDAHRNVKLGDFGVARVLDSNSCLAETCAGTPFYMSPEILRGEKYNRKSDVWSLGCLVYEICSLVPPFQGNSIKELACNIDARNLSRIPDNYSDDLESIITQLLIVNHELRPSIEIILHHPTLVSHIVNNTFDSLTRLKVKKLNNTQDCHIRASEQKPHQIDDLVQPFKEQLDLQDVLQSRLEGLKQRESSLRDKELAIEERERAVEKREKQVTLLDRLTKEKMSRADVYLHQCRDSRSTTSGGKNSSRRHSTIEPTLTNIDTSFSADAGDTSIEQTSSKLKPSRIIRPPFLPPLERHVHFSNSSTVRLPLQLHPLTRNNTCVTKNHKPFRVTEESGGQFDKAVEDNFRNNVLAVFNDEKREDVPSSFTLERSMWLERKRTAYKTINVAGPSCDANKENEARHDLQGGGQRKSLTRRKQGSSSVASQHPLPFIKMGSMGHFR